MNTNISATNVARYFLAKANQEGDLVTNLKIQKLLYYTQAWYLVNYDVPLFKEPIRAWALGPVVKEVYDEFKAFGSSYIRYAETKTEAKPFTKDQKQYLNEFYDEFFKFTAHELVNMTHNEKPWRDAYKNRGEISRQSMKQYYSEMLHEQNGKK